MESKPEAFRSVEFASDAQESLASIGQSMGLKADQVLKLAIALLQWYSQNRDNEIYVKKNGQFYRVNMPTY